MNTRLKAYRLALSALNDSIIEAANLGTVYSHYVLRERVCHFVRMANAIANDYAEMLPTAEVDVEAILTALEEVES